jgi:small subunit ribosomal protein S5
MEQRRQRSRFKGRGQRREEAPRAPVVWNPKTQLGRDVQSGKIKSFDELLGTGVKIMEPQIVDYFFPELKIDYIMIGQSKGKFGGGARRVYKNTQKKVREGARTKFTYIAVVGNGDGYVGMGKGSSRESLPAKESATKAAKLNMVKVLRACGSWECGCGKPHSIPFYVRGKSSSVAIEFFPAPRGTGIVAHAEAKRVLAIAGITDAWSKTYGETRNRINLGYATFEALRQTNILAVPKEFAEKWGLK